MARKGLTVDIITKAAMELVEEKGCDNFSIRELAVKLGVKPASLYNHIDGIEEVSAAVGLQAIKHLNDTLTKATAEKNRTEALKAMAIAYRKFAKDNPELYKTIIGIPLSDDNVLLKAGPESIQPLYDILLQYRISQDATVHFMRSFRSAMHGFVSLEKAGFLRYQDVNTEESYEKMVDMQIMSLLAIEEA